MRASELFGTKGEKELDFDLADDLAFFMKSDHEFYRQDYFPVVSKFHKSCIAGNELSPAIFKNVVLRAYNKYKNKFQVDGLGDTLSIEQLKEICAKLYREELEQFKKEQGKE